MINTHKINIYKTAHYYTIGTPGNHIKHLWIACHGYGQLASTFIKKFTNLDNGSTLVVAPEGLSRFYWEGFNGEVVASWMTKMDRLDEIADYTAYLRLLYDTFKNKIPADAKITLLGFSQGCATQCRWIMREFPAYDHLVLWAGLMPEDLDYKPYQEYFNSKKTIFIYGLQDPYLTPERLEWQKTFASEQGIHFEIQTFNGGHTIDREMLHTLSGLLSQ